MNKQLDLPPEEEVVLLRRALEVHVGVNERLREALRDMEAIASIAVNNEHCPFNDDYANYEATKEIEIARTLLAKLENQQ